MRGHCEAFAADRNILVVDSAGVQLYPARPDDDRLWRYRCASYMRECLLGIEQRIARKGISIMMHDGRGGGESGIFIDGIKIDSIGDEGVAQFADLGGIAV